ncbi:RNA-directed DNA polymerase [Actinacidiphila alni]|uniref:RNA-directed DNA polymerase n=1 Tax=Actinacidiphila alni TaxID=380248 RepID=UPI003453CFDB
MGKEIDTFSVAKNLDEIKLERLPGLIIDVCLADATKELSAAADMVLAGTASTPFETFAMPKKKFGPRPVTISGTAARVAYRALVSHLADDLGPKSRDTPWEDFKGFGIKSEAHYVVKFDIASFYEYIDHEVLASEVLSKTLNPESVKRLKNVLSSVAGGVRGLPQLSQASDHLADVYIDPLQRRLIRDGFEIARYADDFTAPCADWETANVIVERAAEYARNIGLVLSSEKTTISKRETLLAAEQSEAQFINEYFEAAAVELSQVFLWGGYDDDITSETEGIDVSAAMMATMWSLVHAWQSKLVRVAPEDSSREEGHFRAYLSSALGWLRGHKQRLSDDILREIVFKHPLLLVSVCGYVKARALGFEASTYTWRTMQSLVAMGRQSAWAKLWLLDTVTALPVDDGVKYFSEPYDHVVNWVDQQLSDRHEIVRAQAAWCAASHDRLDESRLIDLYVKATPISQAALAAAAGMQGGLSKAKTEAITGDGPMIRKAYQWGERQRPQQG